MNIRIVKFTFYSDKLYIICVSELFLLKIYMIPVKQFFRCFSYGHLVNSPCNRPRLCRDRAEHFHNESGNYVNSILSQQVTTCTTTTMWKTITKNNNQQRQQLKPVISGTSNIWPNDIHFAGNGVMWKMVSGKWN